jgi:predicted PurR-regulated permease PerM
METSQIFFNQGMTFLTISTGVMLILVGSFLIKLLWDLSKLTKNLDATVDIVKSELKPTLEELNNTFKSINSIAQNADKQVDSIAKIFENVLGAGSLAFTRAKKLSGGVLKILLTSFTTIIKLFFKK